MGKKLTLIERVINIAKNNDLEGLHRLLEGQKLTQNEINDLFKGIIMTGNTQFFFFLTHTYTPEWMKLIPTFLKALQEGKGDILMDSIAIGVVSPDMFPDAALTMAIIDSKDYMLFHRFLERGYLKLNGATFRHAVNKGVFRMAIQMLQMGIKADDNDYNPHSLENFFGFLTSHYLFVPRSS